MTNDTDDFHSVTGYSPSEPPSEPNGDTPKDRKDKATLEWLGLITKSEAIDRDVSELRADLVDGIRMDARDFRNEFRKAVDEAEHSIKCWGSEQESRHPVAYSIIEHFEYQVRINTQSGADAVIRYVSDILLARMDSWLAYMNPDGSPVEFKAALAKEKEVTSAYEELLTLKGEPLETVLVRAAVLLEAPIPPDENLHSDIWQWCQRVDGMNLKELKNERARLIGELNP